MPKVLRLLLGDSLLLAMLACLRFYCVCVWAVGSVWAGQDSFLGVERSRIEKVLELGYSMDLGVEAEIGRLAEAYPDSPVPGLLQAGYLYWLQNYLEWDELRQREFEDRAEVALAVAKGYLKDHKEDPDAQFAVAMVELMQVRYFVDRNRWWAAFWKTRSSLKVTRRLVGLEESYDDAKLPLGMANCYLSRTPAYLKPLAFLMRFKGDWELGLRYLQEARDGGLLCRVDAGYYLSAILMELAEDRQASRDELAKLADRFPGNLRFQAMLAELDRGLGKQEAARDRALSVLGDARIEGYPAIRGRAMITLLWSSLGSQSFDLAIETSGELEGFLEEHPALPHSRAWLSYARAEALLGKREREGALELWRGISEAESPRAYEAARNRIREVSAED